MNVIVLLVFWQLKIKFKLNVKRRGQQTKAHGLKPAYHLVLNGPWSKNVFLQFLRVGKKKNINMWKLIKFISMSTNKVLLEHIHTHLFMATSVLQ